MWTSDFFSWSVQPNTHVLHTSKEFYIEYHVSNAKTATEFNL